MTKSTPPWLEGVEGPYLAALINGDKSVVLVIAGPDSGETARLNVGFGALSGRTASTPAGSSSPPSPRAIATDLRNELGDDIKDSMLHSLAY